MKRLLIWDNFELRNTGGPSGYLYNLYSYLSECPRKEITFLSDLVSQEGLNKDAFYTPTVVFKEPDSSILIVRYFRKIVVLCKKAYYYLWKDYHFKYNRALPVELLNEYDFIHFHSVPAIREFCLSYSDYRGKLLLTTHCPGPYVDERLTSNKLKCLRSLAIRQEVKSYRLADYIVFPCKEAREPYEKDELIRKYFSRYDNKFRYLLTSVADLSVKASHHSLKNYGVPDDAFVISFFGRHNFVKGYDVLKQVGIQLLKKHPNLYFLCGGLGCIDSPKHERWIELGFVNNADELIAQSDLYIVPNRDTYFDLVVLQVLRSGVPIFLSITGGNKFFMNLPDSETSGLRYFSLYNLDGLMSSVAALILEKSESPDLSNSRGKANRRLFEKYFTVDKFVTNYIDMIKQL